MPFPFAADDHQFKNAEALENAGAGRLVPEAQLTAERLGSTVAELLRNPIALKEMSVAARSLAHPEAGPEIAKMAIQLAGSR